MSPIKKVIGAFVILALIGVQVGCSLGDRVGVKTGMAAGCVAGAAVGAAISGNVGGAMLGGILGTALGIFADDYFERRRATREEALLRYNLDEGQEKLVIENGSAYVPLATSGSTAYAEVQYTVLGPSSSDRMEVTEERTLFTEKNGFIPLSERTVSRIQGTYISGYNFRVPGNLPDNAVVITTVSCGSQTATIQAPLKIM
ncbi:MAG: hypothetical protein AB1442_10315 [Nitrospirota bacterium]